jgi:hypothetical protein
MVTRKNVLYFLLCSWICIIANAQQATQTDAQRKAEREKIWQQAAHDIIQHKPDAGTTAQDDDYALDLSPEEIAELLQKELLQEIVSLKADTPAHVILGISPQSSGEEIKSAYRKLSLRFHPDKNVPANKELASQAFNRITNAYNKMISGTSFAQKNTPTASASASQSQIVKPQVPRPQAPKSPEEQFTTALINGDDKLAKQLVQKSLSLPAKNTVLHLAAKYGRFGVIQSLKLTANQLDQTNDEGSTPLRYAVDHYMQMIGTKENLGYTLMLPQFITQNKCSTMNPVEYEKQYTKFFNADEKTETEYTENCTKRMKEDAKTRKELLQKNLDYLKTISYLLPRTTVSTKKASSLSAQESYIDVLWKFNTIIQRQLRVFEAIQLELDTADKKTLDEIAKLSQEIDKEIRLILAPIR